MPASGAEPSSPDDALRRRLRDDPAAAAHLEELRRTAYGREGSAAPLVVVPTELRAATGYAEHELPGPLVALLSEEARLVEEGRALQEADLREPDRRRSDDIGSADDDAAAPAAPAPVHEETAAVPITGARRLLRPGVLAAVAAGILGLVGLGTAASAGLLGVPTSDEAAPITATASATPRSQAMGTPDGRRESRDDDSPVPAFTATPPPEVPVTADELAAQLRSAADVQWGMVAAELPDAVRPDVSVERIIEQGAYAEQQVACLQREGVEAFVIGTDSYSMTDADPVAVFSCSVRFPMRPDAPSSDAELAYLHDYFLSFLLPCYAAAGKPYEGEVPDREEFIADIRAGIHWTPLPARMDGRLSSMCPEVPEGLR